MIDTDRTFGTTTIYCDTKGCNFEQEFEGFDGEVDFYGAIDEAKKSGWKIRKIDGEWHHYCPSCIEEEKEQLP